MTNKWLDLATKTCWVALLFLLPITSMPVVAGLLGSDTVAAPSIIFLTIMLFIWFIPHIIKNGALPTSSIPIIIFFLSSLISTGFSFFIDIPTYKEISTIKSSLQSIATLCIGMSFYFIAATYPRNEKDLKAIFSIINWSGALILAWSAVQAISWVIFHRYLPWMFDFQGIISSRVLYHNRVTGFALEPSWLAHQLNMLYLPFWLAASVKRYSIYSYRFIGITFENLLLAGGIAALFLTFSRVGYLAFLCMISVVLIRANVNLINWIKQKWIEKIESNSTNLIKKSRRITTIILLLLISAYILLLVSGAFLLSKIDPRMELLFSFSISRDNPILSYFTNLQFGERAIYWLAGWGVFNDYPILGVGLGNAGFFFPQKIIPYGWTLIEVRKLFYHTSYVLNIKNLWVRLFAETGIIGFAIFCSWLITFFLMIREKVKSNKIIVSVFASAGLFTLVALPAEGFSVDSFALPYWWVSLGLVTAAMLLEKKKASYS